MKNKLIHIRDFIVKYLPAIVTGAIGGAVPVIITLILGKSG